MTGRAELQERIDAALRRAVEAREMPGVVAMAASEAGLLYEGAFGLRDVENGPAMTPDTVFRIASMTKAVTSVAAMQLVEEGCLGLDSPVPDIGEPALAMPQVLADFDAAGKPLLRPAKRPITLKHLLTHTAGFTYDWINPNTRRHVETTGMPVTATGKLAALRQPLAFDPGERWEYGINIDWVGRIVEAVSGRKLDAVLRDRIFSPLGMTDTGFATTPEQRARQARVHQKHPDGRLEPQPIPEPFVPEFWAGGGGLHSSARDYLTFLEMLLHGGTLHGARILRPETVALMNKNHVGDLPCGVLRSIVPEWANILDLFPGAPIRWGLGYMINVTSGPNGRSPGTVSWAGIFNSYYWLDPVRRIAGVILTQMLPFADPAMLRLCGEFERGVYALAPTLPSPAGGGGSGWGLAEAR
ncbi:MAG: serine hydrolase domain-containing protein [Alphaproteobacteria bacterium]